MPKAVKNIIDISEGINSDASAKIISDNSVANAVNVNIDRSGKIRPAIGFTAAIQAFVINNQESGLYSFRTDDNTDTPAEYLLVQNGANIERYNAASLGALLNSFAAPNPAGMVYSNGSLFIYPKDTGSAKVFLSGNYVNSLAINYDTLKPTTGLWLDESAGSGSQFVSGNATPDVKFRLKFDEGSLNSFTQPASGEFDFTGANSFGGGNFTLNYKGTNYTLNITDPVSDIEAASKIATAINGHGSLPLSASHQSASTIVLVESELDAEEGNGQAYVNLSGLIISTYVGGGFGDTFDDGGNIDKVIPSGKYSFSASFVLWDGSETNIEGSACSVTFEDRVALNLQIDINYASFNTFIKGIKFYIESETFEYSLLGEYRHADTKRFKFYNENDFSTNAVLSHIIDLTFPLYSTFRFESGYDVGELASPKMKKFVIVNNRGYALNVGYGSDWNQDRIIISPQGKPFLLPENNKIDIVTEDGDEYITAEHFGSFLFCFKKLTLFILNIGSNDPSSFFLSDSIFGVGVDNEAAVCKTEIGIFWANQNGVYYHNGEQLQNIHFARIEDEWKANTSTVIRCGYDITNKKVVIVKGTTTYSFDIRTNAFSKFDTIEAGDKSNFVVRDKKLSLIVNGNLKDFSVTPGTPSWSITTKDYDLGRRAVRKKVRRFYVTFEDQAVNLANFTLSYALDNTGNFNAVSGSFINNDDTVKNTIAMFDLPRSITAYSVQLKIESTLNTTIKDISIIYRDKLPK